MHTSIETGIDQYVLRFAQEKDTALILDMIRELADYEHLLHEVKTTEEILRNSLFTRKVAEVLIGEYEGKPVSYAIFFYNFSTFEGKPGIYLEDLYVRPQYRKLGLGKALIKAVARLAVERDCARYEWACLDWNEPSIRFYKSLGAVPKDEWTIYRVEGEALQKLAE